MGMGRLGGMGLGSNGGVAKPDHMISASKLKDVVFKNLYSEWRGDRVRVRVRVRVWSGRG